VCCYLLLNSYNISNIGLHILVYMYSMCSFVLLILYKTTDNIYFISVNTTLLPAGGIRHTGKSLGLHRKLYLIE
jgi:hypothetical protein